MDSDIFLSEKIYSLFKQEYYDYVLEKRDPYFQWETHIHNKNIGVSVYDYNHDRLGHIANARYIVKDEKKWLLTKLKYGL